MEPEFVGLEIAGLRQDGIDLAAPGLTGYWSFNEGEGQEVYDPLTGLESRLPRRRPRRRLSRPDLDPVGCGMGRLGGSEDAMH